MTRRLRLASLGIAAALFGVAAVPLVRVVPVAAATWSISLTASATSVSVGSSVELTATANQNVTNPGYYIDIDDETTRSTMDYCDTGKTCQIPVSWSGAGSHTYVAYVDADPAFEYPPCCVQAASNTVTVTWGHAATWSVSLSADSTDVATGSAVPLNATASTSVTGTGNAVTIFDADTGENVVTCWTDATCQGMASETAAGTHSFVAYVDADPFTEYPPCCIQAQSSSVEVTWHAEATAGMSVSFLAGGSLPTFPCPDGCATTFGGSGTAGGTVQAGSGSDAYLASLTAAAASVSGSVTYTEPGFPFCPANGSAVGSVTLSGPASGTLERSRTPSETGTITAVAVQIQFTYERIGATTVISATGGTASIFFTFPDSGPDYFVSSVSGAGLGIFAVPAAGAAAACTQGARALDFTIAGEATLVLAPA